MLGGAAVHFSLAASFFTEVRPVGPVGDDFGAASSRCWRSAACSPTTSSGCGRQVLLLARPLRVRPQRRPHRGHPARRLRRVRAEALGRGEAADTLFLANIQPDLQRQVRAQCAAARFSGLDSMNLWIETAKDSLLAAIAEVDCLVVNDAEIRQLTGEPNLARAARAVMELGPRAVVAKQGEYGAALFTEEASSPCPASRSRTCATRPAPATASPAASSATSTATRASSTRPACGGRWATARCSPPSTSSSSAPSGSPR